MNKHNQTVTVVILTYGERRYIYTLLEYLEQYKRVRDIIVVCNSGEFKKPHTNKRFHIVNNKENLGSAKGYKVGLLKASQLENQFVWLLDDDNLPERSSLEKLISCWNHYELDKAKFGAALQCFRTSQFSYKKIFGKKELNLLPIRNSFLGFHVKRIFRIILNRINPPLFANFMMERDIYPSNAAFYGGFFLRRETLEKIEMPNEEYFMYVDDLDFTHNFKKRGGEIFVVPRSVINDLDFSIDIAEKKSFLYHPLLAFSTNMKAFYYARNVYFYTKNNLIRNRLIYFLNMLSFMALITMLSVIKKRRFRYKVMLAGIKSGQRWYEREQNIE